MITTEKLYSPVLGREWRFKLYLPPAYNSMPKKYPVLYLLHGSGGNENSWDPIYPLLDLLIYKNEIPRLITIAPDTGTSYWIDGHEPFETAFFNDLIPFVDNKYSTLRARIGRGIAGFSMGGYGALRYALIHSQYFRAGILLSPAIYEKNPPPSSSARSSGVFGEPFNRKMWNSLNYPQALDTYFKQKFRVPLYMAVGDDDYNFTPSIEYNIELQVVKLYGKLHKLGGSPAELRVLDGGHNWNFWKPTFIKGLKYILKYIG